MSRCLAYIQLCISPFHIVTFYSLLVILKRAWAVGGYSFVLMSNLLTDGILSIYFYFKDLKTLHEVALPYSHVLRVSDGCEGSTALRSGGSSFGLICSSPT